MNLKSNKLRQIVIAFSFLYKVWFWKISFILSLSFLHVQCKHSPSQGKQAIKVILDTDIGPDVDDAGAIALLHGLANQNEAEILAILCNTTSQWGAPCIDAINTYYKRPNIPIGTLKGEGNSGDDPNWSGLTYNPYIAQHFPNDIKLGENTPDALEVYRQILSSQPDTSVVLISVGTLTNLHNLLKSPADQISNLTGMAMVKKKVKFLSLMAGNFPKGIRKDPNFSMDITASMEVVKSWPTKIVFSGEEIGKEIKTASALFIRTPKENPVREAYLQWDSHFWPIWDSTFKTGTSIHSHDSYDQTSVLYAVRGVRDYWKLSALGKVVVDEKADNEWHSDPNGKHYYLITRMDPSHLAQEIDALMIK